MDENDKDKKSPDSKIRIQTVHISKGDEADNVAIIAAGIADIAMLVNDPRLAYVALTRAKLNLYPRVVKEGLLSNMLNGNYSLMASTFKSATPSTEPIILPICSAYSAKTSKSSPNNFTAISCLTPVINSLKRISRG